MLLVAKHDGTVVKRVSLRNRDKLAIGRSHRCDLVLTASSVSRRHALLFVHAGQWHLVDTGSRFGIQSMEGTVRQLLLIPGAGPASDRRTSGWARRNRILLQRPRSRSPGRLRVERRAWGAPSPDWSWPTPPDRRCNGGISPHEIWSPSGAVPRAMSCSPIRRLRHFTASSIQSTAAGMSLTRARHEEPM